MERNRLGGRSARVGGHSFDWSSRDLFGQNASFKALQRRMVVERNERKQLSLPRSLLKTHDRPIGSADLDRQDERFLLTTCGTVVRLFDLDRACPPELDLEPSAIGHAGRRRGRSAAATAAAMQPMDGEPVLVPLRTVPVTEYAPAAAGARTGEGPGGPQHLTRVRWYPHDQGMFLTGSYGHTVRVWDARRAEIAFTFNLHGLVHDFDQSACARAHTLVAVASSSSHVHLCDLSSGKAAHTLAGHAGELRSVRWSLRSEFQLVSGSVDCSLRQWDIRHARSWLFNFDMGAAAPPTVGDRAAAPVANRRSADSVAHTGAVKSVCMVPGTDQVVSSGADHRVRLWRMADGAPVPVQFPLIRDGTPYGAQTTASADGRLLYHPHGSSLAVLDLRTGRERDRLQAHFGPVAGSVDRSRYQQLYSYAYDGIVFAWVPALQPPGDPTPAALTHDDRSERLLSRDVGDASTDSEFTGADLGLGRAPGVADAAADDDSSISEEWGPVNR